MRRLLSLLVALVMAATLTVPAAAAEDTASTMRLESTEGSVTVKKASGLSVKLQDKMRLYDGYTIETGASSYAYISLDGAKSLKMDADSKASVSKSGKKLEITLVSGDLFVNVDKPLESSESLNIRTSTMVTGVRGTSACVSAPSRYQTEIALLTGRLEVTGRDSHSGQMQTVEMTAGDRVIVAQREVGTPQEHLDIQKLAVQEQELPGFVAVAVAENPELQSKIAEETELSVPLIIGDAAERLAADQEAARQAAEEVQRQLDQQDQERTDTVDPVFQTEKDLSDSDDSDDDDGDDSDDGGSGSGDSGSGDSDYGGTPNAGTVNLSTYSEQELQSALRSGASVVNLSAISSSENSNLRITGTLTIPAGKTLNLNSGVLENMGNLVVQGTFNVGSGATLRNGVRDGAGNVTGDTTVNGTLNVLAGGTLDNYGRLSVLSTNSLHVAGGLANFGDVRIGAANTPGLAEISGTLISSAAAFVVDNGSTLRLTGRDLTVTTPFTLNPGATISLSGSSGQALWVEGAAQPLPSPYTNNTSLPVSVELRSGAPATTHTVTFLPENYTVSSSTHTGTSTNSGYVFSVADGGTLTYTLTADEGYMIDEVGFYAPVGGVSTRPLGNGEMLMEGPPGSTSAGITGDVEVKVTTAAAYTVTFPYAGQHFTVSPGNGIHSLEEDAGKCVLTVKQGTDCTFELVADSGYEISSVTCGGAPLTPSGTIYTIPASGGDKTVTVATTQTSVSPAVYTVTLRGEHFTASPAIPNSVAQGETFSFTLTPEEGYSITSVTGGVTLTPGAGGTFTVTGGPVTGDVTITVTTTQASTSPAVHTVTVSGEHFTASPAIPNSVADGETFSFTLAPDASYGIETVTCNDGTTTTTLTPDTDGNYTVGPVTGDVTVTVTTERITHTVTISGTDFTASPALSNSVADGQSFSFTLAPDAGFEITSVTCDGRPLTPTAGNYTYTVGPVTGDLAITVTTVIAHTVTVSGEHFTADPAIPNSVADGQTFSFTLTPETDYGIETVACIDGTTITILTPDETTKKYTVGPVTGDLTVTVETALATSDLVDPLLDELKEALASNAVTTINVTNTTGTDLVVSKDHNNVSEPGLDIPMGKTLNLVSGGFVFANVDISGTVTTASAAALTVKLCNDFVGSPNKLTVKSGGTLTVNGPLNVEDGYLDNYGTLTLSETAVAQINGDGYYTTNGAGGEMTISGNLTISNNSQISNDGTLTVTNSGVLTVASDTNGGTMYNNGTLNNVGTVTVASNGTLNNTGTLNDFGTLNNGGTLEVESSGSLMVRSTEVIMNGPVSDSAGMLNNTGTLTLSNGNSLLIGDATNRSYLGTLNNSGTLTFNSGTLTVTFGTLAITGGAVGTDSYDSSVKINLTSMGDVNLSSGTLRVAAIMGTESDTCTFSWTGGTIECMEGGTSPVGSATNIGFNLSEGLNINVPPTDITGHSGWYSWNLV